MLPTGQVETSQKKIKQLQNEHNKLLTTNSVFLKECQVLSKPIRGRK